MFFTKKNLKNHMKGKNFTAWLMLVVMLTTMLALPKMTSAAEGGSIVMLASGGKFSLLLKNDGTVWAWGSNSQGQLGDGTRTDRHTPTPVRGLEDRTITAIAAGDDFAAALDSQGKVWVWGDNYYAQLALPHSKLYSTVPLGVEELNGVTVTAIAAGSFHMVALADDGSLWAWGDNSSGKLGLGHANSSYNTMGRLPEQIPLETLGGRTVASIAAGYANTAVVATDGTVWTCGSTVALGRATSPVSENLLGQVTGFGEAEIAEAAIGRFHIAVRDEDGNVWSWGLSTGAKLGETQGTVSTSSPSQVPEMNDKSIIAIAAGGDNTAALDSTGIVWTCGRNTSGQLGNGETTSSSIANYFPETSTLEGFSKIIVAKTYHFNDVHMLGLKSDGTLWAWGGNDKGQLGNGTTTNSSVPVRVAGMATLTTAQPLREDSLNGAQLTVNVDLDSFKDDAEPTQFTLNNAPNGLTVASAVYSDGYYTLTLGFDGDFDTDITNLTVSIAASALNGAQAITTSGLHITAVNEPHITPDEALTEINLDGRILTVELQTGTFASDTLDASGFTLNNTPPGVSISSVQYINETTCTITLAHETTDFDSDFTYCTVTIAGSELNGGNSQTTNRFTITAIQESAVVTSNQALERSSLNGSQLLVILQNDTFRDGSLDKSNFILQNAPSGLSVGSVFYIRPDCCVITLSYDGTYFSQDINNFSITINAAEMSSKGDLPGNSLTITAQPTELSINTSSVPAAISGTPYSTAIQAAGGTGTYTWSASGLPEGLEIDQTTGEIFGTTVVTGSFTVTFTVEDESENTVDKILTLHVKNTADLGKYTITPVPDSSYTIGVESGIATMTINSGAGGFMYLTVTVIPVETHDGDETVVFCHFRGNVQLSINAVCGDFDIVNKAKSGFNVQAGDVIKVYIVDDLTNDESFNPTLLQ